MTTYVEREIHEQPEVLARLLDEGREQVERVAECVRDYQPQAVVIAARGTSDNAARYAQYLFGAHNRLTVALATPSLFTLYRQPPSVAGMLVLGISQSGQSPDIVSVVAEARRQGALSVAITNDPASPLAAAAELVLPLHAGPERAVAATKTYTTQLLTLAMLSAALAGDASAWQELSSVPQAVQTTLDLNRDIDAQTAGLTERRRFAVIGRGYNYATAFEVALKVTELCGVLANPFSSADFLHGPIVMVGPGFPVVLVAPSGVVFDDMAGLLGRLREREAEVVAITDRVADLASAGVVLPLPSGVPEWLSPLVAVVPGQLLAVAQARRRGLNPDQPSGLSKVTQTK